MSDRTCPRCRAQLTEAEVGELFAAIPEANREALLRRMAVRKDGPLPRVGRFVELSNGACEFHGPSAVGTRFGPESALGPE